MLAWSPNHVPFRPIPPSADGHRIVEVSLNRDGETSLTAQDAADAIHRIFPLAPVPVYLDEIDPAYGLTFHTVLDPGSTQAVLVGTWFKASISDPHGWIELEIPQP